MAHNKGFHSFIKGNKTFSSMVVTIFKYLATPCVSCWMAGNQFFSSNWHEGSQIEKFKASHSESEFDPDAQPVWPSV